MFIVFLFFSVIFSLFLLLIFVVAVVIWCVRMCVLDFPLFLIFYFGFSQYNIHGKRNRKCQNLSQHACVTINPRLVLVQPR